MGCCLWGDVCWSDGADKFPPLAAVLARVSRTSPAGWLSVWTVHKEVSWYWCSLLVPTGQEATGFSYWEGSGRNCPNWIGFWCNFSFVLVNLGCVQVSWLFLSLQLEHWSMADIEEALFFIYQKVGCKFYGRTPYQEENRQRQPSNSSVPRPIIDISYDSR